MILFLLMTTKEYIPLVKHESACVGFEVFTAVVMKSIILYGH
jgi:hypothetical protein